MSIQTDLQNSANPAHAKLLAGYFKTGKGEYAEGDKFLGLTVPQTRTIAQKYKDLSLDEITKLLYTDIHEYRLCALFILIDQFRKEDEHSRKRIYDYYLSNTKWTNNWDLVDLSAKYIVGGYLLEKKADRKVLYTLAKSKDIWERRIAVLGTFLFIDKRDFTDSLQIAELLLHDTHDLIHKAVGWMLREIGKKDEKVLVDFLERHYKTMPRTMLRYAVEKFSPSRRHAYLKGLI